jgi:hypothetical protein
LSIITEDQYFENLRIFSLAFRGRIEGGIEGRIQRGYREGYRENRVRNGRKNKGLISHQPYM